MRKRRDVWCGALTIGSIHISDTPEFSHIITHKIIYQKQWFYGTC